MGTFLIQSFSGSQYPWNEVHQVLDNPLHLSQASSDAILPPPCQTTYRPTIFSPVSQPPALCMALTPSFLQLISYSTIKSQVNYPLLLNYALGGALLTSQTK